MLHRVLLPDITSIHTYYYAHLNLMMDIFMHSPDQPQRLSIHQQRRQWFVKPHWLTWLFVVQFLDVSTIVPTNADDLATVLFGEVTVVDLLHPVELVLSCAR